MIDDIELMELSMSILQGVNTLQAFHDAMESGNQPASVYSDGLQFVYDKLLEDAGWLCRAVKEKGE
ncbi:MAG: hypothetical protein ACOX7K_08105 [Oscillospiraceae bacterium]|jgi:hypothetical protein